MVRKLFSYFIPINIYTKNSAVRRSLEVTWNNGELVLDSKGTNYSYGSLQRTLIDEVEFKGKITGVEIDSAVIAIANQYFGLDKINNVEIVIDDAFKYVLKTKETYDLIIIDIFQDTAIPNFLFQDFFINRINSLLNLNGFILFNTMVTNIKQKERNLVYKSKFNGNYSLRMYPKVEIHNELFTIKKLS